MANRKPLDALGKQHVYGRTNDSEVSGKPCGDTVIIKLLSNNPFIGGDKFLFLLELPQWRLMWEGIHLCINNDFANAQLNSVM